MEKEQVVYAREQYNGRPTIIVLDNEHSFFDNYPGKCYAIWDDSRELVTFMETNLESSGMSSADFPYIVAVAPYSCIQSFRVLMDRPGVVTTMGKNKGALKEGRYEYNMGIISQAARNTRPGLPGGTYYDKLNEVYKND